MKFGIIGAGMIANFHAQAIKAMAGGELHSIFGRRAEAVEESAKEHGCKGFTNLDEFLADPELEIVTIATPSGAHLEPALAAAAAGKHIVCEKPLEVTPERIDQMIEACAKAGVTLSGIFNRRFHPAMEVFKKAVDGERFGTLTMADAKVKWFRDQAYYDSGAWRGTWALDGGGALMNQSIHLIDQLIYLVGDVKSVCASMGCLAHTGIEVEDTAVAMLEFKNGARGVIQGATTCWPGHPAEVNLSGDKGSVFLADEQFRHWEFTEETPEDEEVRKTMMEGAGAGLGAADPTAINFTGHQRNFEDVVTAISEGRAPSIGGAEARKAVALICAIYESAKNGSKRVDL
ncbi:MAG: UDP-N-acetyl-2-amino-2-deoxyglucuronate dehydrogenase [Verrucomicrobiales bacterium]|jgi:UDP-N-acetyl-2-amino-2-deoxyglucuronate dehydrogenase